MEKFGEQLEAEVGEVIEVAVVAGEVGVEVIVNGEEIECDEPGL